MNLEEHYKKVLNIDNMPEFFYEFLETPSLQRLKDIDYFCGMKYASKELSIYKFKEDISRYDHSLTTSLITWKLTNNKIKTLAALYHDIATPCFSHVIDYMNKDYIKQETTEKYTSDIILNDKELIKLLEKHSIKPSYIINFKDYSVVDTKRPKLCADRLDGVISTGISWIKNLKEEDINNIVNNITLYKNKDKEDEIGFTNKDTALLVCNTSNLINEYTHSKEDNYMMLLLAKITKLAIKQDIITYNDLYTLTEQDLIDKMLTSKDYELLYLLNRFQYIKDEDIKFDNKFKTKEFALNPLVKGKRLY